MGLPGSGKTTLAKKLVKILNADWLNADKIRGKYSDWDFSKIGILRQVRRMKYFAEKSKNKYVIADFVCPMDEQIKIFNPDFIFWMDTIKKSRYPSMNQKFKKPKKFDLKITTQNADLWKYLVLDKVIKYKWDNQKPTSFMLGRFQPWHLGHRKLFEKIFIKYGQVNIQVKDVHGLGDNPYTYKQVKKNISDNLIEFKNRILITKAPNICEINYGRTVGYKIKKVNLAREIELISATKIRKLLRRRKLLR
mgnify:FL=1